jgi:hypothetical protein
MGPRLALVLALAAAATAGCRESKPRASPSKDGPVVADAGYAPSGKRPVNPRRPTAPATITAALAVGATAPDFELPATTGRAHLADVLARGERALLIFYRGDW